MSASMSCYVVRSGCSVDYNATYCSWHWGSNGM